jgi:probable HAF family extracellular repeat protein
MTSTYQRFAVAAASAVLSLAAIEANSAQGASLYSVTDLGSLSGSTFSYANNINNVGQVVFNASLGSTNGSPARGFLYSNGQLLEISPPLGDTDISVTDINNVGQVLANSANDNNYTGVTPLIYSDGTAQSLGIGDGIAYAINDSGQAVGGTTGGGIFPELAFPAGAAFLYSRGTTTIINTNSGGNYVAYGLNNLSQVVGIFGSPSRAFLYDNGAITNLGTLPGDDYSLAEDINDLGQVVGYSAPSGIEDATAFLYSSTTGMTSLGRLLPTDNYSAAFSINNNGQVVGWSGTNPNFYTTSGEGIRAFLYSDGVMQDLNSLIAPDSGVILTQARAINDRGEIVGAGSINGELHAVLLTPQQDIPEPASTIGVLLFSALGAGWQLKRKL